MTDEEVQAILEAVRPLAARLIASGNTLDYRLSHSELTSLRRFDELVQTLPVLRRIRLAEQIGMSALEQQWFIAMLGVVQMRELAAEDAATGRKLKKRGRSNF